LANESDNHLITSFFLPYIILPWFGEQKDSSDNIPIF